MDIRMPGMDGLEATRRLAGPGVANPAKVIVITTFDVDDYVFTALRAGASGFLLKDAQPEVLIDAIRRVHEGHGLIAPEVTRRLISEFAAVSPDPSERARLDVLSDRERAVLCRWRAGARMRRSARTSSSRRRRSRATCRACSRSWACRAGCRR